ncbi:MULTISPECIES: hypothetical protein [unclassified Nodularia (in: cyanobacteria)]|uniref:hypothetical protein n=1 Tax=unclassified Nodularia (in: cyanobacteria) TaxID=2656917 RepID=UPI00188044BF|nr:MULTISPECIES: hypothetical protein [unclassified Nodularia (in: cyanobacteria)]MBE9200477.1 hypothetical protein [Nodularia sp. LEGE 06071]MCC2695259.1 hypothetical protein [Nodularia sp. LEGE 04288]
MQLVKSENKKSSILPLLAVGTFGLHLFSLLLLLFHSSMIQDLKQQLTPQSLVQLVDGRAITVDPQQTAQRHPETIRRFVGETMTLMLTWSQQQPPMTVWEISSQLLANDLKPKFQAEITNLNPTGQLGNINRETEYILVIEKISQPTKIADGKWKIEMLANQLYFSGSNNLGTSTSFNKQILVRAIDQPATSLPTQPLPWHLAAYRLGEAKLEIYEICDIKDNNCY